MLVNGNCSHLGYKNLDGILGMACANCRLAIALVATSGYSVSVASKAVTTPHEPRLQGRNQRPMTPHTLHVKLRSAKRLDEAMTFRGLTNRGLAARTGIHRSTIAHWRSGQRKALNFTDALKIAGVLDMPTGYLFVPEVTNDAVADRRSA